MTYPTIWPHFFTASILHWKHLLKDDEYKDIIVKCLKFLVDEKRIQLNAFAILSNHVHIICSHCNITHSLKYKLHLWPTRPKAIKKKLCKHRPDVLKALKVNKHDRT